MSGGWPHKHYCLHRSIHNYVRGLATQTLLLTSIYPQLCQVTGHTNTTAYIDLTTIMSGGWPHKHYCLHRSIHNYVRGLATQTLLLTSIYPQLCQVTGHTNTTAYIDLSTIMSGGWPHKHYCLHRSIHNYVRGLATQTLLLT